MSYRLAPITVLLLASCASRPVVAVMAQDSAGQFRPACIVYSDGGVLVRRGNTATPPWDYDRGRLDEGSRRAVARRVRTVDTQNGKSITSSPRGLYIWRRGYRQTSNCPQGEIDEVFALVDSSTRNRRPWMPPAITVLLYPNLNSYPPDGSEWDNALTWPAAWPPLPTERDGYPQTVELLPSRLAEVRRLLARNPYPRIRDVGGGVFGATFRLPFPAMSMTEFTP